MPKLIQYRDAEMSTYTYFYVHPATNQILSPYFDSVDEAEDWLRQYLV